MLIDEIKVHLTAGHGGRGAVAFNNIPASLGPTGADGGRGGSIYFEGVSDVGALSYYRSKKEIKAKNGEGGKRQFRDGENADDLILPVPAGTVVLNEATGEMFEITKIGERIRAVEGGIGGRGNFKFRGSTNTSPTEFEEGKEGESGTFILNLKLIADVGIIGLPNSGKSSLLNALTSAKAKVGNYQFTTLEPNLGAYYDIIIADIPGLIEGAAEGKGLGTTFLKHIERTTHLIHLVSAESDDPVRDYNIVRDELKRYNKTLVDKPEHIFLSQYDTVTPEVLQAHKTALKKAKIKAEAISIYDDASLNSVKVILNTITEQKRV